VCAVRSYVGHLLLQGDRYLGALQRGQVRSVSAVHSGWSIPNGFRQLTDHTIMMMMMMLVIVMNMMMMMVIVMNMMMMMVIVMNMMLVIVWI